MIVHPVHGSIISQSHAFWSICRLGKESMVGVSLKNEVENRKKHWNLNYESKRYYP